MLRRVLELLGSAPFCLDATPDVVAGIVCEEMADVCGIAILSEDSGLLHPVGLRHRDPEVTRELDLRADLVWRPAGGLTDQTLSLDRPVLVRDADWDELARGRPIALELFRRVDLGSAIMAPMRGAGELFGTLNLGRARSSPPYSDDDLPYAQMLADALGLALAATPVQETLGEQPDAPPASRELPGLAAGLSDRELQVLRLIADGLTNAEIAGRLYLSVRTIEWHRSRLAAKLGVSRRSELVAVARRLPR